MVPTQDLDLLAGVDLNGADLTNAQLPGAANANLARVDMNAMPYGAYLANATVTNASFTNANLAYVWTGGITGSPSSLPANWVLVQGYFVGPNADLVSAD